jgi:holo-[acyl-carrier protein] synthase
MIFGIGIDTIEVARIEAAITKYGTQFTDRIFSEVEYAYSMSRAKKYEHFAARFAAKEAFAKALGTGVRRGFRWKEVSVRNQMSGRPQIELTGYMTERAKNVIGSQFRVHLSLTHTADIAEAIVTIELI